jgi:hypothetical protein
MKLRHTLISAVLNAVSLVQAGALPQHLIDAGIDASRPAASQFPPGTGPWKEFARRPAGRDTIPRTPG